VLEAFENGEQVQEAHFTVLDRFAGRVRILRDSLWAHFQENCLRQSRHSRKLKKLLLD